MKTFIHTHTHEGAGNHTNRYSNWVTQACHTTNSFEIKSKSNGFQNHFIQLENQIFRYFCEKQKIVFFLSFDILDQSVSNVNIKASCQNSHCNWNKLQVAVG